MLSSTIEEGDKIKLSKIVITGNKAISENEIKSQMKNQEHWFFSFLGRSGTLRTDELKEDLETIRNLYYNKGYIQVQVDEPVIKQRTEINKAEPAWFPGQEPSIYEPLSAEKRIGPEPSTSRKETSLPLDRSRIRAT